jgi:hypothetical protein
MLAYLGDGNVKVGVEAEDGTGNKDDKDGKGSVLKVGQLNLHATELDSPANGAGLRWWGLEAHGLPVGRLQVLKVVGGLVVIHVQQLLKDDQGVADEKMGDMAGQQIVDTIVRELLVNVLVVDQRDVVVLGPVVGVVGDVRVDRVVA